MAPSADTDEKLAELKAFDETKAGVKGLVDAGITTLPSIFLTPAAERDADEDLAAPPLSPQPTVPVIEISAADAAERIRDAAETWGFFQVVGHGVPQQILDEMIDGVRRFNDLDVAEKSAFYGRDKSTKVRFNSTFDLYQARRANWRDTLGCVMAPFPVSSSELPATCREIIVEYSRRIAKLGEMLLELLSAALGLRRSYLKELECDERQTVVCHYYPPCPQPELTLGTSAHFDPGFITVLLQDDVGGLQVRYRGHWVDVQPVPGALVLNIADLMQLITNDRFKSVEHRVVANQQGPRISVATSFTTYSFEGSDKIYGPIEELVSEDSPPKYRKITIKEFSELFISKGLTERNKLVRYRLPQQLKGILKAFCFFCLNDMEDCL